MKEHLKDTTAIEKLKSLVTNIKTGMFCTSLTELPIRSRPMTIHQVDDEGNLWFISSSVSNKYFEIKDDNRVQIFFADNGNSKCVSVYGTATIYRDLEKIKELWTMFDEPWFEDGKEDPKVRVIKVVPENAYYWDTKDGEIISLLKMAGSALFGTESDIGVEGKLDVK